MFERTTMDLDASVGRDAVQSFLAADDGQVADRSIVTSQSTYRLVVHVRIPQPHQTIHSCRQYNIAAHEFI